jgi:hypothetical protein
MKDAKGHGSNAHNSGIDAATKPVALHPSVLAHIQQNPGGFSVRPNGSTPSTGYMVSVPGRGRVLSESDLKGPSGRALLQSYAAEHAEVLRQPGSHIGGWTDKETGKTHLDISENIKSLPRAVSAGKARNQIAIYDVKGQREIRTGGTGE